MTTFRSKLTFGLIICILLPLLTRAWSESDTVRINELNRQSFDLIKRNPDSATILANKAIRLSEVINFIRGLSDGYARLGIIEKDRGNFPDALRYYRQSLAYRLKMGDKDLLARIYNNIGNVYSKMGIHDSSAYYMLQALRMADALDLEPARAMYAMNLGIAYEKNRDFDLAIQYIRQARKLYENIGDSAGIVKCLINESAIFIAQQDYQKAKPLLKRAIILSGTQEMEHEMHLAIGNLAVSHMNLLEYDSSLYYMRIALDYNNEIDNLHDAAIDMSNLGVLFHSMGNKDSAYYWYDKSLTLSEANGDLSTAAKNALGLSELHAEMGNYHDAYLYRVKHTRLSDSLFNETKTEVIAELQTRYETEKKEAEIRLLNKEKEVQQKELSRKTVFQNFLVFGIIAFLLIGFLFFNRYKLKQKIEKQKALLEERKRISAELHDDLGAQLSATKMFLSDLRSGVGINSKNELLDNSIKLLDNSISDLRKIMDDLHTSTLQEKGLIAATEELVNKMNYLQNIRFHLAHHGLDHRLNPKIEHQLFRITQELINNTMKYAQASNVTIEFLIRDNRVVLTYEDDGVGFDIEKARRGYGLSNISSRVLSMEGTVDFDSQPGAGSRTFVEIPINYD